MNAHNMMNTERSRLQSDELFNKLLATEKGGKIVEFIRKNNEAIKYLEQTRDTGEVQHPPDTEVGFLYSVYGEMAADNENRAEQAIVFAKIENAKACKEIAFLARKFWKVFE